MFRRAAAHIDSVRPRRGRPKGIWLRQPQVVPGQPYLTPEESVRRYEGLPLARGQVVRRRAAGRQPGRHDRGRTRPSVGHRMLRVSETHAARQNAARSHRDSRGHQGHRRLRQGLSSAKARIFPSGSISRPAWKSAVAACSSCSAVLVVHRKQERSKPGKFEKLLSGFWQPGHARDAEHVQRGAGRLALWVAWDFYAVEGSNSPLP